MNLDEKIKQRLPQDELLAQLAEECSELSQAALKLRRALTGINPTPVTADEARKNLVRRQRMSTTCWGCCWMLWTTQRYTASFGGKRKDG